MQYMPVPKEIFSPCCRPGTLQLFTYESRGQQKSALVYLPHGYADHAADYPTLYLMHGGGGDHNEFFGGPEAKSGLKNLLDNMIEQGRCKPMIVVTPGFSVPGRDESWGANNFWYELENYLIPAFESAYNTYATDVTPEGLRASRGHRAFAGFSMGAMCTWNVFSHCLEEIAYYMPFSGAAWGLSTQTLVNSVADAGYTKDDFFIYAGCGGVGDIAYQGMNDLIDAMSAMTDTFVFCENFRDGNLYYTQCNGGHSRNTVELIMYAGLPTFFDK